MTMVIDMNYFLVGTETYNMQKRRDAIIKEAIGDSMALSVYRGKDCNMTEALEDCQMPGFFAERKAVIIENPDCVINPKENDPDLLKLKNYLESANPDTTLIVYVDVPIDRRKSVIRELAGLLKYETYDQLNDEDFRHEVKADINRHKLQIDTAAVNELLERLPLDIGNWKNELEKLSLYPEKISVEAVRQLIARPVEEDVFQLSNAVTTRNLSKAVQIYRDLLVNNRNDVKGLIGLLAYQFRFMCQIKTLSEQGCSIKEIADRYSYNEYRVKIGLRNCQGTSSQQLLELLSRLSQLDQDILAGKVEGRLGLELFIMEACR